MVQPQPIRPSPIWLLYTNLRSGFRPLGPAGHSMGISYVAAPVGLTLNSAGMLPTAGAAVANIYGMNAIKNSKTESNNNFISIRLFGMTEPENST